MENLKDEVLQDMKTAMREKNSSKLEAIRAVKGALDKFEKENPGDTNYAKALKPLVKQRIDSIEQFRSAGSIEHADKESAELAIINVYLEKVQPKQMNLEEMKSLAMKCIAENNLGKADMGKVMSYFKTNHDGQYDGKELSSIVRTILA
jgi:hypothetical protein